jgi:hypothetical protein
MSAEKAVINKSFSIDSPTFALRLLIISALVWISVVGEIAAQPSDTDALTPTLPVAQKSTEPKTQQKESTTEDVSKSDLAIYGMSWEDYDKVQQRFLKGVKSGRSSSSPSPSPSPSPAPQPSSTPNPTPGPNPRPSSRPTPSPQPSPQPNNNGTLFNAGGPTSAPVPFMPKGTCPRAFPIMLTGGCYSS